MAPPEDGEPHRRRAAAARGRDPIGEDAARAALGADLYDDLAKAGLFEKTAAGLVRSVLKLWMFEGVLFFADDLGHGGDAVMGPGQLTSALVQVAGVAQGEQSKAPAGSALELGCGAAVTAICLARRFQRVVATDINPRAQILATVNAAINGASNIEVRVGDLYAPVAGETFDSRGLPAAVHPQAG
ncbi:MAG: methyltransferase [Minicystis sp.]